MTILRNMDYKVAIVDLKDGTTYEYDFYKEKLNMKNLIDEIISVDVDALSISEAYIFLHKIQYIVSDFTKNQNYKP